ncbi:hypothetical protein SOMG_02485 [Schizosaccharomyces osmophilus]|uniref:Uncharacterized protein n=1 Tax=Schizosaccharomyces osmophilus TaxID=2545709 RepID=A0AAE9W8E7_9SCHI|nr:uncharacterized protein SOMG_02485 [Schizosaccharomyces osmophilus]WBW71655.1 hypothetical protein SOMG_02485 [Schizosaccharomyces osmophilus]
MALKFGKSKEPSTIPLTLSKVYQALLGIGVAHPLNNGEVVKNTTSIAVATHESFKTITSVAPPVYYTGKS